VIGSAWWRRGLTAVTSVLVLVLSAAAGSSSAATSAYQLTGGPFAGRTLLRAPVQTSVSANTADEELLTRIAGIPQAIWLTGGTPTSAGTTVSHAVAAAAPTGAVTQFVVYDIPRRDCTGGQSAGGAATAAAYQSYVGAIASALTGAHAIVVLEPDALAGIDCLGASDQSVRYALLKWAVGKLAGRPNVLVYLDAGNAGWQTPATIASRLIKAGIVSARGFALDVSNFDPIASELSYGKGISSRVGWKRFVVDTSRNGTSPRVSGWCNPAAAALGALPGTPTGYAGADAFLWIKHPGESDGVCGASTAPAGQFDPALALSLAHNAGW
jgi:endoglucanase